MMAAKRKKKHTPATFACVLPKLSMNNTRTWQNKIFLLSI